MARLEELLHLQFTAVPSIPPIGELTFIPMTAATLRGPGIEATLASPGGDRMRRLADGTIMPDVSLILRTEAGAAIGMDYYGVAPGTSNPDPDWPIRTTIRFMASDPDLLWLTRAIFVGAGRSISMSKEKIEAEYRIFRVG